MKKTSSVSGVLLAAGPSTRMGPQGRPKQLLPLGAESLVRRAAKVLLASRLQEVVVVLGHAAPLVEPELAGLSLILVNNPSYQKGQSSSVRVGLAATTENATAALFLPCDQPFVDACLLDHLIATHDDSPDRIVIPTFAGRRGAPVIFPRSDFPSLLRLRGDQGGRQLLPAHEERIVEVPVASASALCDVDTWEDYESLLAQHAQPEK